MDFCDLWIFVFLGCFMFGFLISRGNPKVQTCLRLRHPFENIEFFDFWICKELYVLAHL